MRFSFNKKKREYLYYKEKGAHKYPPALVDAFFVVMTVIQSAADIRDLYNLKSLHFEKLKGDRKEEHSMRLNRQYRLTMRLEKDEKGILLIILNIEDYHG